jgi:hypothetical protein
MNLIEKLRSMFKRRPMTPEELEAQRHAQDAMLDARVSQRSIGAQNYQSGRGRDE